MRAMPNSPSRRGLLLVAVFFTAVAVYGSLVPLTYRPLDWAEAVARFREIRYLSLGVASRADWVANILLFVPLGFLWLAVSAAGRSRRVTVAATVGVVGVLAALSVALEFTQLWFPPRTVSLNDIIAETIGAALGAALWLTLGPTLTAWLVQSTAARRPNEKLDWLLEAYLLGLIVYSVLPLDLTIRPAELVDKYRDGKIALLPFAHWRCDLPTLYGLFRDVIAFVPVGMLAATWHTPTGQRVRPTALSLVLGVSIAATIEAAQLLVYSRFTDFGDILLAAPGVAVGAVAMRRWYGRDRVGSLNGSTRRGLLGAALGLLWCGVLAAVFCLPWEPIDDPEMIRQRYEGFWRVPFAAMYWGTEFNAVSQVLKKLLFFAPLGAIAGAVVLPLRVPRIPRAAMLVALLAVAAGVAATIEMVQVFLPPHVPDITDVLLCTAGAAAGMLLPAWFQAK